MSSAAWEINQARAAQVFPELVDEPDHLQDARKEWPLTRPSPHSRHTPLPHFSDLKLESEGPQQHLLDPGRGAIARSGSLKI